MGIDRIMFAIDWPFVANPLGTEWIAEIPLCEEDKIKLLSGNTKRILKM
jgi:2,3-dihydroxybenzoate decarboxylase